ncbi:hypothetical protein [Paludisphaera borealis]|uniref:hypothetical protein n=1 Tax=Paludisphaera borealis TaxID=1387353 RepID=UPI000970DA76|nr:hypothetical protein [Paludisphaera borealis]
MSPKINGLMVDAVRRVFNRAARAVNSSDAVKRPTRQGAPSCESLEGRVVLSNWGGADLLGGLSQIGVVTTVLDAGGPRGGQTQSASGASQTSQTDTDWQTLQTKIQGLAAKSAVTVADLSALTSDSQAIATAGGGLKTESLQTVLGSLATAVAGGADTTQAQADFNALFSGSKVDQATIDKTFTDLVQTIKDSKITTTDLTDFAAAQAALPNKLGGPMNVTGFPGAPGGFNGAGPGGNALTASLANAGVTALPTTTATAIPSSTSTAPAGGTQSSQLQTDLDKLRTDQQAVTAKSAVTSDDLDQLKTDSQNITTAGLNFDPKTLQTAINNLVTAVAGGADTTQAQTGFNALFAGSSVSQTVIDKTFTDLVQTIKDSKITADDATLIAADQTAVQADFAALPQGGAVGSVGQGGFGGGFGGRDGGFGGGMVSRIDRGGMGSHVTASVHGSATSSNPGVPAVAVSGTTTATPATTSDTKAPRVSSDPGTPTSTDPTAPISANDSVVGGRGRGGARAHFVRSLGGRFGRNTAGGSEGGAHDFASGMNNEGRMTNRPRRR